MPREWERIYRDRMLHFRNDEISSVLNSYLKLEGENLKISSSTNKVRMSKTITNQTLSEYTNVTNINENEIVARVDASHLSSQKIGNVNIIDEETTKSQILTMLEDTNGIRLVNNKNEFCGYGEDWYDDDNEIPDEFKNKDNIVLKPEESGETLLTFTISGNTKLPKKSYREYNYIEDLGNLQRTNLVSVNYFDN